MQQATSGTSAATYKLMEPHWIACGQTVACLSGKAQITIVPRKLWKIIILALAAENSRLFWRFSSEATIEAELVFYLRLARSKVWQQQKQFYLVLGSISSVRDQDYP